MNNVSKYVYQGSNILFLGVLSTPIVTGVLDAAIKACEAVDTCVGNLIKSVKKRKGALIVTADHGKFRFDEKTTLFHLFYIYI